ncbi:MAG: DHA2 family efflux MFS transporter permease subunit, partial [Pseudomonadales bacterium]
VQGASTGLIGPIGMIITFQVFPPHQRGRAMGIFGVGTILAPALGPTLGGVLIDQFSWHYVFFVAVPFSIFALPTAVFFIPGREASGKRKPFDWIGFTLMMIFIPTFMLGFSNGQREGWDSTIILTYFTATAVSGVAFVLWENHIEEPMLNLRVFLNKRFVAAAILTAVMGAGLYGSTYLVPLFLQTLQGLTPTASGLLMMPAGLAMAFIFLVGGELSDRFPSRVLIMLGLAFFAISSLLLGTVDLNTPYWSLVWWAIIGRIGIGLIFPSLNRTALSVLGFDLLAQGAGALNFLRQLGSAFGVNLIAIELERRTSFFRDAFFTAQGNIDSLSMEETMRQVQLLLTPAGLSSVEELAVSAGYMAQAVATEAGVMGFRDSFMIIGVLFLACLIPAWFMPHGVPGGQEQPARPPPAVRLSNAKT